MFRQLYTLCKPQNNLRSPCSLMKGVPLALWGEFPWRSGESSRGIRVNVLDCDIVVSEYELHRAMTFSFSEIPLGKILIPSSSSPAMGYIVPLLVCCKDSFGWYAIKQRNNYQIIWKLKIIFKRDRNCYICYREKYHFNVNSKKYPSDIFLQNHVNS